MISERAHRLFSLWGILQWPSKLPSSNTSKWRACKIIYFIRLSDRIQGFHSQISPFVLSIRTFSTMGLFKWAQWVPFLWSDKTSLLRFCSTMPQLGVFFLDWTNLWFATTALQLISLTAELFFPKEEVKQGLTAAFLFAPQWWNELWLNSPLPSPTNPAVMVWLTSLDSNLDNTSVFVLISNLITNLIRYRMLIMNLYLLHKK